MRSVRENRALLTQIRMDRLMMFFKLLGIDKYAHIIVCALLVGVLKYITGAGVAVLLVMALAIGKEIVWDKLLGKGDASIGDVWADIIGVFLGVM